MKKPTLSIHSILTGLIAVLLLLPTKSAQGQNLFVDTGAGDITQIAPNGVETQFASGLSNPTALAFDSQGNLYASVNGAVEKISPAGAKSIFTILPGTGEISLHFGMAFDASGNLWASSLSRYIYEYSPAGSQIGNLEYQTEITSMAFDASGNLFTANYSGSSSTLMEQMPGQPPATFATGLDVAEGIAFNNAGDLFVADYGTGDIYEYTPGGIQSVFATGLDEPLGLAFDGGGNLLVTDYGDGDITKITPDGIQSTFATGLDQPGQLAFQGQVLPIPEPPCIRLFVFGVIASILTLIGRAKHLALR